MRWPGSAASSEARFTQQHIVHPRIDRARSSDGNVSVLVGKQVLLRCVIDDLGNESVSRGRAQRVSTALVIAHVYVVALWGVIVFDL